MGVLISRHFSWVKAVLLSMKFLLGVELLLCVPLAVAQNNLGELLDAGAKKMSAEEFRQELVQRVVIGPTATGGSLEIMYTTNGTLQGTGRYQAATILFAPISGEWTIDDNGRLCTSMRMGAGGGTGPVTGQMLPSRCQFWFKYVGQYFLADSDSDRGTRVFRRTVKQ